MRGNQVENPGYRDRCRAEPEAGPDTPEAIFILGLWWSWRWLCVGFSGEEDLTCGWPTYQRSSDEAFHDPQT